MKTLRRVARNVTDLTRAERFYALALGFARVGTVVDDVRLAEILGVAQVKSLRMGLGAQIIELTALGPSGAVYPADARSDAGFFQHIAIVTTDIAAASDGAMRAGAVPISVGGPQLLPPEAGGVSAWKFRDPDGHPLEFLQFPPGGKWRGDALHLGFDHSAIGVADVARSVAFYETLGLKMQQRQLNQGPAQDRLDGLGHAAVDVVAMMPEMAPPHVELLAYHTSGGQPVVDVRPNDIAADRLVFGNASGDVSLTRDPDGHFLLLDGR